MCHIWYGLLYFYKLVDISIYSNTIALYQSFSQLFYYLKTSSQISYPSFYRLLEDITLPIHPAGLPMLRSMTLTCLSSALRERTVTPVEALDFCLSRAELSESAYSLNNFIFIKPRASLIDEACASADRYANGSPKSPIDGVPISVKANLAWQDHKASASSKVLANYTSPIQADVVARLIDAGALIIGQTNMDEFGMGSANTNSAFGPSVNSYPYLSSSSYPPPRLSPGGSSGGSASSVVFRSSFASIGTDTGGSVRLPAAYCNVTGFKPTYGSISRHGVIAYASSLDTVG